MLDKIIYNSHYKGNKSLRDIYNDEKAIKRFLNNYSTIRQTAIDSGYIDIIDVCEDIISTIKKLNFGKKQTIRIGLWMAGYKEYEIAEMQGVSRVMIHNFIDSVCIKISEQLKR